MVVLALLTLYFAVESSSHAERWSIHLSQVEDCRPQIGRRLIPHLLSIGVNVIKDRNPLKSIAGWGATRIMQEPPTQPGPTWHLSKVRTALESSPAARVSGRA
jgi:hypothetical protein